MKRVWPYITMFFAGAFAAMLMVFYSRKPQTVINAETYIAKQEQKIGKIKQKGQGNAQEVEQDLVGQNLSNRQKRKLEKIKQNQ